MTRMYWATREEAEALVGKTVRVVVEYYDHHWRDRLTGESGTRRVLCDGLPTGLKPGEVGRVEETRLVELYKVVNLRRPNLYDDPETVRHKLGEGWLILVRWERRPKTLDAFGPNAMYLVDVLRDVDVAQGAAAPAELLSPIAGGAE